MPPEWLSLLRWENWGAILRMSPGWIALVSGLFGAVITAIFNYFINVKLAKREQKRKEQRIAYVYLAKISQLLSLESSMRQYIADSPQCKEVKGLLQKNWEVISRQALPFTFCVVIAGALKKDTDFMAKIKEYYSFFGTAERLLEQSFDNFKIPVDLLAQFPRDAIIHYEQFIGSILGVKNIISQWLYWIKTGDTKLISDTVLYSHYLSGKLFIEASHKYYDVIKNKAGISTKEAEELLRKQKKESDRIIKESLFAEILMGKISEIYFESTKEKQHCDNDKKLIKK